MWRVFVLTLLISLTSVFCASNETECISTEDCQDGEFCTDSGVCAEGPSEKCPEKMHYRVCGSKCPKTCADVQEPNREKFCVRMCVDGCFCNDGYVLDESTNKCVPEAYCQKESIEMSIEKRDVKTENSTTQCPENSEFSDCTNLCPEKHCGGLTLPAVCFSLRCGPPGCRCEEGHVLKTAGKLDDGCVKIETCSDFSELQKSIGKRQAAEDRPQDPRCPKNAEYKECTNVCGEKHCGNILVKSDCISLRCGAPGCQCKEGHVRLTTSEDSACVRREACPKLRLRRHLMT